MFIDDKRFSKVFSEVMDVLDSNNCRPLEKEIICVAIITTLRLKGKMRATRQLLGNAGNFRDLIGGMG